MVIFHRLATDDYVRARRYYARIGPGVERQLVAAVSAVVLSITRYPNGGTAFTGSVKWIRTRRFPYLLYFELIGNGITMIYAVAHSRRKPGYWLRRRSRP